MLHFLFLQYIYKLITLLDGTEANGAVWLCVLKKSEVDIVTVYRKIQ